MFSQNETKVSYFEAPVSNTTPTGSLTLYQVYRLIVGESKKLNLRERTEKLRSIEDTKERKRFKGQSFPHVSFGGEFNPTRKIENLSSTSNLLILDFDHIGDKQQVEDLKQRISEDGELDPVLLFRSPSGDGLKVVVNIRQEVRNDSDFKSSFNSLKRYFSEVYSLDVDESGKDISRTCFLPYDENAILRQAGSGFDVEKWRPVEAPKPQVPVRPQPYQRTQVGEPSDYERALIAVEDIESSGIDITKDRKDWRDIGFALSTLGEEGRSLFHRVSRFYPDYDEGETNTQFDSFLRGTGHGITLNSLFSIAKNHGVPMRPSNVYQKQQERGKTAPQRVEMRENPSQSVEAPQTAQKRPKQRLSQEDLNRLLLPTTETEIIERESKLPQSLSTGYCVQAPQGKQKLLLMSGKLTEIAGATGHGKTLFLMNLLLNVARLNPDKRFLLFTYEENSDTIIQYLLNIYLSDLNLMRSGDWRTNRVLLKDYFSGNGEENINQKSLPEFRRRKDLFFRQYIETGRILVKYVEMNSSELCQSIEFLSNPQNNIGGVFVDYFQYINPDPDKRFPTRQEALKSICIELKDVANRTGLPVVLACQFNQEVLSPTDVLLNKIGEAGDISRIGSECWGLWQMGKDIGRELKGKDQQRVEDLEMKSGNMGLRDPFLKGMFLRVLKSRIVETGSEEMFEFRGLTGKITPNDPEESLSVEDWNRPDPTLTDDDLPEF